MENIISGKKPVADTPVAKETPAEATASGPTGEEKTGERENQEDGELPTDSEELKALKSELKYVWRVNVAPLGERGLI